MVVCLGERHAQGLRWRSMTVNVGFPSSTYTLHMALGPSLVATFFFPWVEKKPFKGTLVPDQDHKLYWKMLSGFPQLNDTCTSTHNSSLPWTLLFLFLLLSLLSLSANARQQDLSIGSVTKEAFYFDWQRRKIRILKPKTSGFSYKGNSGERKTESEGEGEGDRKRLE